MAKGKEIATRSSIDALDVISQAMDDEASGFMPQPVHVKIMHQEGMFMIPSLDPVRRLEGIILASRMIRVFFPRMGNEEETKKMLALTDSRPFCSSQDYLHGNLADVDVSDNEFATIIKDKIAEGGGDCNLCPLGGKDAWGSVELLGRRGRGKACTELRRILFWRQGMTVPVILPIPSTSIRAWDGYCSALEAAGLKHNKIVTEISADVKEASGMKWSVLKFVKAGNVTEEMATELVQEVIMRGAKQPLFTALVDIFRGREISMEDYPTNGGTEGDEL